jgi:hypothetical protein
MFSIHGKLGKNTVNLPLSMDRLHAADRKYLEISLLGPIEILAKNLEDHCNSVKMHLMFKKLETKI